MSKKSFPFVLAFVATIVVAGISLAESPALPASYQSLDTDRDGAVSEAEYVARAVALAKAEFKQLDQDGSGALQAGELSAAAAAPRTGTAGGGSGMLRRTGADDPQRAALKKRISSGPSMRQGGR